MIRRTRSLNRDFLDSSNMIIQYNQTLIHGFTFPLFKRKKSNVACDMRLSTITIIYKHLQTRFS